MEQKNTSQLKNKIVKYIDPIMWFIGRTGAYLLVGFFINQLLGGASFDTSIGSMTANDIIKIIGYIIVLVWLIGLYGRGFDKYNKTKNLWVVVGYLLIIGIIAFIVYSSKGDSSSVNYQNNVVASSSLISQNSTTSQSSIAVEQENIQEISLSNNSQNISQTDAFNRFLQQVLTIYNSITIGYNYLHIGLNFAENLDNADAIKFDMQAYSTFYGDTSSINSFFSTVPSSYSYIKTNLTCAANNYMQAANGFSQMIAYMEQNNFTTAKYYSDQATNYDNSGQSCIAIVKNFLTQNGVTFKN